MPEKGPNFFSKLFSKFARRRENISPNDTNEDVVILNEEVQEDAALNELSQELEQKQAKIRSEEQLEHESTKLGIVAEKDPEEFAKRIRQIIGRELTESENLEQQMMKMARDIIEGGLELSTLENSQKNQSIFDYLKNELAVDIDIENWEDVGDLDKIDELITYNWKTVLKNNAKKLGVKTLISAGAAVTVGGILGFFTGGTSWGLVGAGLASTTGGRAIVEGLKSGFDLWGKGKSLRIETAKKYLMQSLELRNAALDVINNSDDPERFLQACQKLIDIKTKPTEIQEDLAKSKQELASYEKKWNTAEEGVALVGGVALTAGFGLIQGQEIVQKKLEYAAKHGIEINFDGKGLGHMVQKLQDGFWHFAEKSADIQGAIHNLGSGWTNWLHTVEAGAKGIAQAGQHHVSKISEEAVKGYIQKQVTEEMVKKVLVVASGLFVGAAGSWGAERKNIADRFNIKPEQLASKEVIGAFYGPAIERELAKYRQQEASNQENEHDILKNARIGEIYLLNTPTGEKARVQITDIDQDKILYKSIESGPKNISNYTIDLKNRSAYQLYNKNMTPWNNRAEYTYREWEKITKFLQENQEIIKDLAKQRHKEVIFKPNADIEGLALNKDIIYSIYNIDPESNKAYVYDTSKGYTSETVKKLELSKILGLIDIKKTREKKAME